MEVEYVCVWEGEVRGVSRDQTQSGKLFKEPLMVYLIELQPDTHESLYSRLRPREEGSSGYPGRRHVAVKPLRLHTGRGMVSKRNGDVLTR